MKFDINNLLINYWTYLAGAAIGIWAIYVFFKNIKLERKKKLQTVYMQLTEIIREFQLTCLNHLSLESEVMHLKLVVAKDIKDANDQLINIDPEKKAKLMKRKDELLNAINTLQQKLKNTADKEAKIKLQLELKKLEEDLKELVSDIDELRSKNKPFLDKARNSQMLAEQKLSMFHETLPQRFIALSEATVSFTNKLKGTPEWQLISSGNVIKHVNSLESSVHQFNLAILNYIANHGPDVSLDFIVKSDELKNVWNNSEKAIKSMRSEIF